MTRLGRVLFRVALVSVAAAPCVGWMPLGSPPSAWADALPSDPDSIYYHCTPAEQCPTGSEICPATIGPAGQRPVEATCAAAAEAKKLERRCWGRNGHLYCPAGATGTWKSKAQPQPASTQQKRGC